MLQAIRKGASPPMYIVENTAMMAVALTKIKEAYAIILSSLGQPIILDAARVGSYAHRLRNYWTNLAAPEALQLVLDSIHPNPDQSVADILEPGR